MTTVTTTHRTCLHPPTANHHHTPKMHHTPLPRAWRCLDIGGHFTVRRGRGRAGWRVAAHKLVLTGHIERSAASKPGKDVYVKMKSLPHTATVPFLLRHVQFAPV